MFKNLTGRQIEILARIAEGASDKDIAAVLNLSPHTIKTQVKRILKKLGVNCRTEAAALYWKENNPEMAQQAADPP